MKREEIINQLCVEYLQIDFTKNLDLRNKSFFSKEINAMPRDVLIVMYKIEKDLCIKFSDEFIKNGGIKSFQSIVDYINKL